jgi:Coenzyme PQQ synthesis protein D (PqqD)
MAAMAERSAGSLGADFAPARAASVYAVELDGELVLLDEHQDRLHHLNPTASVLWSCFDGEARVQDLARDISGELGLSYELVLADTVRIVRELGAEGLLDGVAADDRPVPRPE